MTGVGSGDSLKKGIDKYPGTYLVVVVLKFHAGRFYGESLLPQVTQCQRFFARPFPISNRRITRSPANSRCLREFASAVARSISRAAALSRPAIPWTQTPRASSARLPPIAIQGTLQARAALATPAGVLPN